MRHRGHAVVEGVTYGMDYDSDYGLCDCLLILERHRYFASDLHGMVAPISCLASRVGVSVGA
jgi:hypothetical protein